MSKAQKVGRSKDRLFKLGGIILLIYAVLVSTFALLKTVTHPKPNSQVSGQILVKNVPYSNFYIGEYRIYGALKSGDSSYYPEQLLFRKVATNQNTRKIAPGEIESLPWKIDLPSDGVWGLEAWLFPLGSQDRGQGVYYDSYSGRFDVVGGESNVSLFVEVAPLNSPVY